MLSAVSSKLSKAFLINDLGQRNSISRDGHYLADDCVGDSMLSNQDSPTQRPYLVNSLKRTEFQGTAEIDRNRRECGAKMPLLAQLKWYVNRRYWRQMLAAVCAYSSAFVLWELSVR